MNFSFLKKTLSLSMVFLGSLALQGGKKKEAKKIWNAFCADFFSQEDIKNNNPHMEEEDVNIFKALLKSMAVFIAYPEKYKSWALLHPSVFSEKVEDRLFPKNMFGSSWNHLMEKDKKLKTEYMGILVETLNSSLNIEDFYLLMSFISNADCMNMGKFKKFFNNNNHVKFNRDYLVKFLSKTPDEFTEEQRASLRELNEKTHFVDNFINIDNSLFNHLAMIIWNKVSFSALDSVGDGLLWSYQYYTEGLVKKFPHKSSKNHEEIVNDNQQKFSEMQFFDLQHITYKVNENQKLYVSSTKNLTDSETYSDEILSFLSFLHNKTLGIMLKNPRFNGLNSYIFMHNFYNYFYKIYREKIAALLTGIHFSCVLLDTQNNDFDKFKKFQGFSGINILKYLTIKPVINFYGGSVCDDFERHDDLGNMEACKEKYLRTFFVFDIFEKFYNEDDYGFYKYGYHAYHSLSKSFDKSGLKVKTMKDELDYLVNMALIINNPLKNTKDKILETQTYNEVHNGDKKFNHLFFP